MLRGFLCFTLSRILATGLLAAIIAGPGMAEESFAARSARMKREHEQRAKQMQKEFDAVQKKQDSVVSKAKTSSSSVTASAVARFNSSVAPRPEVCFDAFLRTARQAKSFQEILPFLPADQREHYEREQKLHDPRKARERQARYQQEGQLDEEQIRHLTAPPYENGLRFYQTLAQKVNQFVAAKVQGEKANLDITIHIDETINGVRFTKSTATVGMIVEGDYWRFESFKEGQVAER